MTKPLKIDFVSDVMCPWCAVGLGSLEQALGKEQDKPAAPVAAPLFRPAAPVPDGLRRPPGIEATQELLRKRAEHDAIVDREWAELKAQPEASRG